MTIAINAETAPQCKWTEIDPWIYVVITPEQHEAAMEYQERQWEDSKDFYAGRDPFTRNEKLKARIGLAKCAEFAWSTAVKGASLPDLKIYPVKLKSYGADIIVSGPDGEAKLAIKCCPEFAPPKWHNWFWRIQDDNLPSATRNYYAGLTISRSPTEFFLLRPVKLSHIAKHLRDPDTESQKKNGIRVFHVNDLPKPKEPIAV